MNLSVLILPGDGIGVEVTREAVKVLRTWPKQVRTQARRSTKVCSAALRSRRPGPFPGRDARTGAGADATLLGAVGLPEFDNAPPEKRPERGLFGFAKPSNVYAEPAAGAHRTRR